MKSLPTTDNALKLTILAVLLILFSPGTAEASDCTDVYEECVWDAWTDAEQCGMACLSDMEDCTSGCSSQCHSNCQGLAPAPFEPDHPGSQYQNCLSGCMNGCQSNCNQDRQGCFALCNSDEGRDRDICYHDYTDCGLPGGPQGHGG